MNRDNFTRQIIRIPTRKNAPWKSMLVPARILVLGFASVIFIGTLLLNLPIASQSGESLPLVDAFFTATSAACITGLVTVDTGTTFSLFGQLVILTMIQVGGLGIMTMTTMLALVMGRKINLRERLIMQQAMNVISPAGVVRLTKYVLLVTLIFEAIGALLLSLRFVPQLGLGRGLYYSVFHSISSFCTAGFDLFGPISGPFSSMTAYAGDPLVSLVVSGQVVIGGIGFAVIVDIYNRGFNFRRLSLHSKLVLLVTGLLVVGGALMVFAFEYNGALAHLGMGDKLVASIFQSITPRTGGYNTVDQTHLHTATGVCMIIMMFIGASPGGTGGGIKTTTFATLVLAVRAIISGRREISIFGRVIPQDMVLKSLAVAVLSAFLVVVMVILLSFTENADLLTLSYETVSAFGTVGLTMGLTPSLSLVGKLLIAFTMFAGRLGPLTIAIAVWSNQVKSGYRYPEERIMIG